MVRSPRAPAWAWTSLARARVLADAAAACAPAGGLLRLPVDRGFTLRGFGTVVVTGNAGLGKLAGDWATSWRSCPRAAARSRARPPRSRARRRDGVEAATGPRSTWPAWTSPDLLRGDVLTRPGTLRPTSIDRRRADFRSCPESAPCATGAGARPPGQRGSASRVHLAGGSAIRAWGGAARPAPSSSARPWPARGDRLVIRSYCRPLHHRRRPRSWIRLPRKRRRHDRAPAALRSTAEQSAHRTRRVAARRSGRRRGTWRSTRWPPRLATVPVDAQPPSCAAQPGWSRWGRSRGTSSRLPVAEALGARLRKLLASTTVSSRCVRHAARGARRRLFLKSPPGTFEHVLERLESAGELRVHADAVSPGGNTRCATRRRRRASGPRCSRPRRPRACRASIPRPPPRR